MLTESIVRDAEPREKTYKLSDTRRPVRDGESGWLSVVAA
jgi:hypothetical protein